MDLWTEYEGITVDGAFPLNKLLKPEGRSAFFATCNSKGESVLIRLIECHFDEDEILARWRGVQALGHPNFLCFDRFGQLSIDDTTVVYAAFERVDTDLGHALEQGCLSVADATQIGLSIASALETLHAHGFVHEHVEPRNIFGVGETVKLRSDCIRETPEGDTGLEARRRDVHDLSLVLMQVLLGNRRRRSSAAQTALPAPFEEVVRKGMTGEWGLAQIREALAPRPVTPLGQKEGKPPAISESKPPIVENTRPVVQTERKTFSFRRKLEARSTPSVDADRRAVRQSNRIAGSTGSFRLPKLPRAWFEVPDWLRDRQDPRRRWLIAGGLLFLVVLCGWLWAHETFGRKTTAASPAASSRPLAGSRPAASERSVSRSAARSTAATRASAAPAARGANWRVVAFTYNREDQARKKASALAHQHPGLTPEAFSPTGGAPWLVTVGGSMQRDDAYAMAHKARSLGLPGDTYARNYPAR